MERCSGSCGFPPAFSWPAGEINACFPTDLATTAQALAERAGVALQGFCTKVGEGRIHHLEAGSGPPVLLLHGGTGGALNWYKLFGPLSRRFRVVAPDFPGFGLSQPSLSRAPLGVAAARVVSAWMPKVGINEPSRVVGTSFGGLVALRLALQPNHVRSLVLVDSAGLGRSIPLLVRAATLPLLGRLLVRPTRAGQRFVLDRLLTAGPATMSGEERNILSTYLWRSAKASDANFDAQVLRQFARVWGQRERLSDRELRDLRLPTLIVWGGEDRFFPLRHARRGARLIPQARLAVIEGVGHSPNWEAPASLLNELLPFLKEERDLAAESSQGNR